MPEMGEYVVGAYLRLRLNCDFVDYNVRPAGGGLKGLGELDVVGLRFEDQTAFLCEVTTHLGGLEYGRGYEDTIAKIKEKYERQKAYATESLRPFPTRRFMFWSPVVPEGFLTAELASLEGVELFVNAKYKLAVEELRTEARSTTRDVGNPFFRSLQIQEHLRA